MELLPALLAQVLLALVVVRATPPPHRTLALALASSALLLVHAPVGAGLLLVWSTIVWLVAPAARDRPWIRTALVLAMLAQFAALKYWPGWLPAVGELGPGVLVPLGLSYFTFRLLHYAIDVSRGRPGAERASDFFAWALFFPVFLAGPIERFRSFAAESEARLERADLVAGGTRILHGLVKKFALAEVVAVWTVDLGDDPAALWLWCAATFVWVYLDFSAYTDLAIGVARLFGVRLSENFRWPLLATDIGEFWRRWHITLVDWLRDYVYFPLLARTRNAHLSVYALWLALALWHAGSLSWVAWGLWHATGITLHRAWRRLRSARGWRPPERGPVAAACKLGGGLLTFAFVSAAFAFTLDGAPLSVALERLARMFFLASGSTG